MVYPFMTLEDNTEITHTEMLTDGKGICGNTRCKRLFSQSCLLASILSDRGR